MDISKLEKRYQEAWSSNASASELFALDKEYYAWLENAFKQNPSNVDVLIHLGIMSWEPFHESERAIEFLQKAISLDPENVEARFWLAKCYYHDYCSYERAKQLLLEAIQIDPHRADCLSLLSSIIMDTTKNITEAIQYREKAVLEASDWPMLRFMLANLYLQIGEVEKAEFHAKKGLECNQLTTSPKNDIDDYYEKIVTGRRWKNLESRFKDLIDKLRK